MGEMMLLIYYGGELSDGNFKVGKVLSDDNYKGNTVMVFVPYDLTYNDLMKTINQNVKVDLSKFSIELRAVLICTSGKRVTVKIENDRDVTLLIREDKLIPEVYVITGEKKDDGIAAQNDQIEVIVEEPIDEETRKREEEETRKREKEKTRKRKRQLELYRAAVKGDWGVAEHIFKNHPEDIESIISKAGDTVLHIATAASHTPFVRQLVEYYDIDLTATNHQGNTAFCLAAAAGNMDLIKLMMKKENKIAGIRARNDMLPVQIAAMHGHKNTVIHLYNATKLSDGDLIELLVTLIENSLYDAALQLLDGHPDLATLRARNGETALHVLARKPLFNPNQQGILRNFFNLFSGINTVQKIQMDPKARQLVELLWERMVLLDDREISYLIGYPWMLIFVAAEQGNDKLLSILIRSYPDLIFKRSSIGYTLLHVAVIYRNKKVFNLIYQKSSFKDLNLMVVVDENKDNILHTAAKLPPPNRLNIVSGEALQLHQELLWFKELSNVVTPLVAEAKNNDGLTPKALFTQQHKELLVQGEEWMKRTAESCMLVSTLIATVVFAAAITVPGGIKEDTGAPHFLKKPAFMIFAISDTISLVSSSCSILTFLSIFTARYAVDDFLRSLPNKLFWGVWTLFVSIVAMMVVFCATMFIIFYDGMIWPFVLAVALGSFPVFVFIYQQNHILHLIHFSKMLKKGTLLRILPWATRK